MPLTNPSDALLPPAVPPYTPDVDRLHAQIGQLTVYCTELSNTLLERAHETNSMHDRALAAEAERDAARARIIELEQQLANGGTGGL